MTLSKLEIIKKIKLYAVTDLVTPERTVLKDIEDAYRGGADVVQLRSKKISDLDFFDIGKEVRKLADRYKKLYFVNDRIDIALSTHADGLHLGQNDLPVAMARKIARNLLLGKSTHSLEQALATAEEAVDYIGVGPVYGTPTKPGYSPVGLDLIRAVAHKIKKPFIAIGGIGRDNVTEVLRAGASRIAAVRAIFAAENVYEATKQLRKIIEDAENQRR